ncbi:hypothetical protein Y032_0058g2925 [Ancylostoma ceylanicum]|uniref:Dickkopf N-terminal cysteine-rich domain-containing protein n=1 Tax=Ancylostoma ceylanicum TaxID=53326 RepID=A0A016U4X8_9BILA|nr:hypothetical protein Y032_0058g2925 [Ancylostoma ceylanicum]
MGSEVIFLDQTSLTPMNVPSMGTMIKDVPVQSTAMKHLFYQCLLIPSLCVALSSAQICISDVQCRDGAKCVATMSGYSMCSKIGGGVQPDYPTPPSFYCNTNNDCAPSQVCAHPLGGPGICQDARIGGIGLSCQRDSDCTAQQRCVDHQGQWQCMALNDVNECNTSLDCPAGKICAYSTFVSRNVCVNPGPVPTIGGNVGSGSVATFIDKGVPESFAKFPSDVNQNTILSGEDDNSTSVANISTLDRYDVVASSTRATLMLLTADNSKATKEEKIKIMKTKYTVMRQPQLVPKHAVIDPAALPCDYDYQCRMGESCTGVISLVDRNVTVCQYDVTKEDRMCIFHADCLQGQRCSRNKDGTFVCTTSIEAALGTVPCTYDYECSGGENCVNIADQGKEKVFRCRQSTVKDPRRDQLCRTNAECPYQQVCRRVAGVNLCVDVAASTDPAAMLSIQRKVVKFVQDLLFTRL